MTKLHFICTFKSDIVLHASSNTEGKIERLDYIPGSNFLGMVASQYQAFGEDAFDVFHSGAVRFGDGHVSIDDQSTFHVPFSWFSPKGDSLVDAIKTNKIFNEHFLTKEDYRIFIEKGKQLKQQRVGFLNSFGKSKRSEHLYTQKSAYDKDKRRSKDKTMFGYYALSKGTKWHFCVEVDEGIKKENIDRIKNTLLGSSRLGKSRSAEYGQVTIEENPQNETPIQSRLYTIEINEKSYIFLYAYSRLALTDANGVNCYQPDLNTLCIEEKDVRIDWSKSQIRTSRYTPYVGSRKNFDPERLIINKGSIIAIEVPSNFNVEAYAIKVEKGVGLYLSEGHGKLLVNPVFLTDEKFTVVKENAKGDVDKKTDYNSNLNTWLTKQKKKDDDGYNLLKEVKEFIKDNLSMVKNKKSQWGQIRSLCMASTNNKILYDKLFDETMVNNHKKGFLLHGRAKDKWNNSLIEMIKKKYNEENKEGTEYVQFVKLLSIYAPKEDDKEGENDE